MRHYENKEELKAKIEKSFEKYIAEFEDIPEELKDYHCSEVDRSPAENLAYQVGWTTLLLQWEEDEKNGRPVKAPSEDFKWNQLGDLYKWFTETYADQSLSRLVDLLRNNVLLIEQMIDSMSEEELFQSHI